jgi:hypothetical protein
MESTMEGGCFCGRVRYRVDGAPLAATLCHCQSCRRATGGVNVAWAVFENANFALLSGDIAWHSSSPGIQWGHCASCGSLVLYRRDSRPDHTDVTTTTLDDPNAFPPTVEIWIENKLAWEQLNPALPNRPRSSLNE